MTRGGTAGSKGVPRAERERQILDAAAVEFGKRGYAAMSVADAAERAGISKPLVYSYFVSKEGLFCACLDRAGLALTTGIAAVIAEPDDGMKMADATLAAIFAALEPRPHDWNILYDRSIPRDSAAATTAEHYREQMTQLAAQGVATAFTDGHLTDPLDLSAMTGVWMNTITALVNWWLRHPDQTARQMTERSHRILGALASRES